jgi:RecJ-like exonuclease
MAYSGNIDADLYDKERESPMIVCPQCKGKGEIPYFEDWIDCPLCDGEGEIDQDIADTFVEPIEYDGEDEI